MLNKVILMGRLTRDPELKHTQTNIPVCSFTIAVDRRFKKDGQPEADFISIVAWRQTGEFVAKHFTKGKLINVCGSLQSRSWEQDGKRQYATEVIAEEVNFCGDKGQTNNDFTPTNDGFEEVDEDPDSLPF